jgi:hypothetical protein
MKPRAIGSVALAFAVTATSAGCGSSDCDCAGPQLTITVLDANDSPVTADQVSFAVNGCDAAQAVCVDTACATWTGELYCMREGEDTVSVEVAVSISSEVSTSEHTLDLDELDDSGCCQSYEPLEISAVASPP